MLQNLDSFVHVCVRLTYNIREELDPRDSHLHIYLVWSS